VATRASEPVVAGVLQPDGATTYFRYAESFLGRVMPYRFTCQNFLSSPDQFVPSLDLVSLGASLTPDPTHGANA